MITSLTICTCFITLFVSVESDFHKRRSNFTASDETLAFDHRRLQFDGMFDTAVQQQQQRSRRKKQGGVGGNAPGGSRRNRPKALTSFVESVIMGMERYNLWWTGPPDADTFKPAEWGAQHRRNQNAIFSMAVIQGAGDSVICSSPNDFRLFIGSARRYISDIDVVVAVESNVSEEVKSILKQFNVIVYVIADSLCSRATRSIFCGSTDERVPASVFRYYFYEKWASAYSESSLLMLADFRDMIFQSNPFTYNKEEWYPEHQLVLFQEFHPNMVINRCVFNKRILSECYGEESLRLIGSRVIISSGSALGTRDAIIAWSHHITMQLQDAPGRMVETRCTSGGIDHSFINYLVYGNKLRPLMRIRIYHQGEGPVNTIGGLNPNTVIANISGPLKSFWKLLDSQGYLLNWNGDVSPAVHQIDHFLPELEQEAKTAFASNPKTPATIHTASLAVISSLRAEEERKKAGATAAVAATTDGSNVDTAGPVSSTSDVYSDGPDIAWQVLAASRCLWGCSRTPNSSNKQ